MDFQDTLDLQEDSELSERTQMELEWRIQHIQHLEGLKVLTGGVANDLNNLLMTIAGNMDLLEGQLPEALLSESTLGRIRTSVKKASELTFQMLSYVNGGNMIVEALNLRRLITETEKMLSLPPEKRAILDFDLKDVPAINADVSQITRLVMNMIMNASEIACPEHGTIGISLYSLEMDRSSVEQLLKRFDCPDGQYIFLKICDNGCRVSREALMNMFSTQYEGHQVGRGLGMASTLQFIRNLCGVIMLNWDEDGERSITVCFPSAASQKSRNFAAPLDKRHRLPPKTILIADDNELVLLTTAEMLEVQGHRVIAAKDGYEAVKLIRESVFNIDCAIIDLNMPELSGKQTFSILRRLRPDIPVVLSSGCLMSDVSQELSETGVNGLLRKPFDTAELMRVLHSVFEQP